MPFLIPTRSDLFSFSERISLDGKEFDLDFRWNTRDERWYLSIYESETTTADDGSREAAMDSIPILAGTPLLQQCRDRRRPLGEIFPFDTSGGGDTGQIDPAFSDLGVRVVILYFTRDEVEATNTTFGIHALDDGSQEEP